MKVADILEHLRQVQIFKGEDLAGDLSQDTAHTVVVVEVIAAETGQPRNFVSEVQVVGIHKSCPAMFGETDLLHQIFHFLRSDHLVVETLNTAVDTCLCRKVDGKVQVGTAQFQHLPQIMIDNGFVSHIQKFLILLVSRRGKLFRLFHCVHTFHLCNGFTVGHAGERRFIGNKARIEFVHNKLVHREHTQP